ncbi:MAG TPA: FHA domain-containing protein [Myxococcaceae bacterium]|jgi:pSer/pThr/pTyr-binding forkhead associated (FHA) protein|nr:FHA domain-containing protein [Myxococcaceae bacterium]
MKLDILQHGESHEVDLPDGTVSVGGAPEDGVRIEGLPPHLLDLKIDQGRATLCPRETLSVDDVLVPRNVPRLLMPGECVSLGAEVELRVVAPPAPTLPATAAVLKQLLGGAGDVPATRAANLTCLTGLDMGRRFPIAGDRCVVGRGNDATLRLRDRAVSRSHARLRRGREGYYVEDLGSPNGVYVNGGRVRTIRVLNEGDILELGRSLLRFSAPVPDPQPATPPPPPADASQPTAPPRPPKKRRRRINSEWALIGMGAALALAGLWVSWGFAG